MAYSSPDNAPVPSEYDVLLSASVQIVRGKPQTEKPKVVKFKVSYDFYRLPDGIGDHVVSMKLPCAGSLPVNSGHSAVSTVQSVIDTRVVRAIGHSVALLCLL